ncbi:hypothetical protein Syun_024675 [Stephania yunnanensis]|uniref:HMA domain-containing protein n=1 Tax=Stephania yunnanensis TaxID=152371 RepID=A0AAP0I4U1_9MAGN
MAAANEVDIKVKQSDHGDAPLFAMHMMGIKFHACHLSVLFICNRFQSTVAMVASVKSRSCVLKTEVDSSLPKVTVLGNVEAKVLIKKLAKAGKQAQVWATAADDQSKPDKGKKEEGGKGSSDKEIKVKADENCEKKSREQSSCKSSSSCSISVKKIVNDADEVDISKKKKVESASDCSPKTAGVTEIDNFCPPPVPLRHLIQAESSNCLVDQPDAGNVMPYCPQYCYNIDVERPKVPQSTHYCAVASLVPPPLCYYDQEPRQFYGNPIANQHSVWQEQPPVSRVGDYFSDENTMGCHVM